ncbi:MAG TPA: SCO family protein [Candidatus Acidoferrum sp.]|nr:SCO family protein [Candidatus Acidoferrum sp.]
MIARASGYLLAAFVLMLAGSAFAMPMASRDSTNAYAASGVVVSLAPGRHTATIHNQAIPGYMMEMTMDFPVQETNELNGIVSGDQIAFTVMVTKTDSWIRDIHRTGHSDEVMTNTAPSMTMELKEGDPLPDGTMTAEDGRQIHFSDFRGDALAFTFFYTRCPLPNFCPLMNRNFADARDLISSTPGAPTNWECLSISFDPDSDTPAMLTSYASLFRGQKPGHWLFAAASTNTLATLAPALDLMLFREGDSISHNLRTVVLDPKGRVYRQFDGNQWTARELADAVLAAARK